MAKAETLTMHRECGVLGELEITVHYHYDYTPARLTGAPEDCYPADEAFEILKATVAIGSKEVEFIIDDSAFEDECLEKAAEQHAETMNAAMADHYYERTSIYRECE